MLGLQFSAIFFSLSRYGACYAAAWQYIKNAIEAAGRHGMGVLIGLSLFLLGN